MFAQASVGNIFTALRFMIWLFVSIGDTGRKWFLLDNSGLAGDFYFYFLKFFILLYIAL